LRPKRCLFSINLKLRNIVASKLTLDWSPKQISGWLKTQYPDDESMRVSHETIYRSLFIQARGALKKELLDHLRSKRRIRRSQHSHIFKDGRGQIPEAISIRERPAEVEDRAFQVIGRAISCAAQGRKGHCGRSSSKKESQNQRDQKKQGAEVGHFKQRSCEPTATELRSAEVTQMNPEHGGACKTCNCPPHLFLRDFSHSRPSVNNSMKLSPR
jgi:hypothetical protein